MTKTKTLLSVFFVVLVLTTFVSAENICFGDFDNDGDVDGTDAFNFNINVTKFNENYGRNDCLVIEPPINNTNETNSPIITLLEPDDNDEILSNTDERDVTFEYMISDTSDIAYCELIIDNKIEARDESIYKGVRQEFEEELDSNEKYDWKIKCVDIYGNIGLSEEWDFEIIQENNKNSQKNENLVYNGNQKTPEEKIYTNIPISLNQPKENTKNSYFNIKTILPITLGILILISLIMIIFVMIKKR